MLETLTLGLNSEKHYPAFTGTMETFIGRASTGHTVSLFYSGLERRDCILAIREPVEHGALRPDFGVSKVLMREDFVGIDPMVLRCTILEWEKRLSWGNQIIPAEFALSLGA